MLKTTSSPLPTQARNYQGPREHASSTTRRQTQSATASPTSGGSVCGAILFHHRSPPRETASKRLPPQKKMRPTSGRRAKRLHGQEATWPHIGTCAHRHAHSSQVRRPSCQAIPWDKFVASAETLRNTNKHMAAPIRSETHTAQPNVRSLAARGLRGLHPSPCRCKISTLHLSMWAFTEARRLIHELSHVTHHVRGGEDSGATRITLVKQPISIAIQESQFRATSCRGISVAHTASTCRCTR